MNTQTQNKARRLILINANVLTPGGDNSSLRWITIKGDRIERFGEGNGWEAFEKRNARVIDCRCKTVLPGFIDPHVHLFSYAESLVSVDLRPVNDIRSIADIQASLRRDARNRPEGSWIRGRGYDEFHLTDRRHPNRWDLDAALSDHPVKITHRSGHAHVLNSFALNLIGLSRSTPDPPGGMIERDLETGEPTGLLFEMGDILSKKIPNLSREEIRQGIVKASKSLAKLGITSVVEASAINNSDRWHLLESWKNEDILIPRIQMMIGTKAFTEAEGQNFLDAGDPRSVGLAGVKIILDETTGRLHPSEKELNELVLRVHRAGMQVSIHAIEERAVEAACESIAFALRHQPRADHRHRIEHCAVCRPGLARKIAALGILVVSQPAFVFFNGERYLKTVPKEQLKQLYAFNTLRKAGVRIAGSSDCPIVAPDPLIGITTAVTRKTRTGTTLVPQEGLPVMEALKLYGEYAAYASFQENDRGSLVPGKLADLVMLSDDPTQISPAKIMDLDVELTIIGGKVVWDKQGRNYP